MNTDSANSEVQSLYNENPAINKAIIKTDLNSSITQPKFQEIRTQKTKLPL